MYNDYVENSARAKRFLLPWETYWMRQWDRMSADPVDFFLANSANVARQIRKYYRRIATVVYPPIDVASFSPAPSSARSTEYRPYYLCVGQLVRYKRIDLAVEAFTNPGCLSANSWRRRRGT